MIMQSLACVFAKSNHFLSVDKHFSLKQAEAKNQKARRLSFNLESHFNGI